MRNLLTDDPDKRATLARIRHQLYDILQNTEYDSRLSRAIEFFLILLILGNVATVIMSSVDEWYAKYEVLFNYFENLSLGVFTLEYLVRLWAVADSDDKDSPNENRMQWLKSPSAMVDLAAILPAYVNFFVPIDLRFLIVLRLLRLFKLNRYFVALRILLRVIAREKESFKAVVFILLILIVLAASGIYLVEKDAQPEAFGSIPHSMWWAVVTLTTVGYGDVTPITTGGKILGAVITILGVGLAALPAGILASGLANELNVRREQLEIEFHQKLIDHDIDIDEDEDGIEHFRKEVGLNQEQSERIVKQMIADREHSNSHIHTPNFCPNCGHHLNVTQNDTNISTP